MQGLGRTTDVIVVAAHSNLDFHLKSKSTEHIVHLAKRIIT